MSPKSDHFLYRHTIRSPPLSSTGSPINMPRKSSYTLDSGSSSYNHHHPHHPRQQSSTNHNQHYRHDFVHSTSQPVSLQYSKSEDSQRIFNGDPMLNGNRYSTTASSSSTSNEMLLDPNQPRYERVHFEEPTKGNYFPQSNHLSSHNNRDSGVETSNRDSFESSSTSASVSYLQYKDEPAVRRPSGQDETNKSSGRRNHTSKHQYGKILGRNQTTEPNVINNNQSQTTMASANPLVCQPYAAPTMPYSGNGRQRNVNFEHQVTCDNNQRTAEHTQPTSNNNNQLLPISAGEMTRNHQRATIHRSHPPPPLATASEQHVSFINGNGPPPKHHHLMGAASDRIGAIGVIKSTASIHRPSRGRLEFSGVGGGVGGGGGGGRNNSVMVRPMNRVVGGGAHAMTSLGPPHQLVHMINSLSSPESAYSTGYSTDGTSPGMFDDLFQ